MSLETATDADTVSGETHNSGVVVTASFAYRSRNANNVGGAGFARVS
jgi:hypothetical protein